MAKKARLAKSSKIVLLPTMEKMPRMGETVTKDKKSKLPKSNKMVIVAKMARVAAGQNNQGG